VGSVVDMDQRISFDGRGSVGILLAVEGGGYVRCVCSTNPFDDNNLRMECECSQLEPQVHRNQFRDAPSRNHDPGSRRSTAQAKPLPVYPLTDGLQQRHVAAAVAVVLDSIGDQFDEALPPTIRQSAAERIALIGSAQSHSPLLPIAQALRAIHQPDNLDQATEEELGLFFKNSLSTN